MTILRYYWYVSNVSTFPNTFPLALDSNLHNLNETNPGLMLLSVELPWCYFRAEIKVLRMEQNFVRNFHTINKNFRSQDPPERGTWVGTTHQGAPPLLEHLGGLSPPGGPADPKTDAINSYFSRKNQGEIIIVTHETEPPSPPVLHREARSGVRLGIRRGGSSFFIITNPSPSPIPWCSPPGVSNSFVGSMVGEELDEIHHVIELVLLGLDP